MPTMNSTELFASTLSAGTDNDSLPEIRAKQRFDEMHKTTKGQAFLSSMGNYNPVTAFALSESKFSLFDDRDPYYDPEEDMTGFEEYSDVLVKAKNPLHMERLKNDITRKNKYDDEIANAGAFGIVTTLAAGVLSPAALFSWGATVPKGVRATASFRGLRGVSRAKEVAKSSGKFAGAGALGISAEEAVLQYAQPSLSLEESLYSVSGGALLGGFFGGALRHYNIKQVDEIAKRLKEDISKAEYTPKRAEDFDNDFVRTFNEQNRGSVGAMKSPDLTKEQLSLVDSWGVGRYSKWISPTLRVMQSSSVLARKYYRLMAEVPLKLKGQEDVAMKQSAETYNKLYDANLNFGVRAEKDGWKKYKESFAPSGGERQLTRSEYRQRISQAMRRDDKDVYGNEAISNVASQIRKDFFDPIKEQAIDAGLLPKDVEAKFAESYLNRRWDTGAIMDNLPEFKERLASWATEKITKQVKSIEEDFTRKAARLNEHKDNIKSRVSDLEKRISDLDTKGSPKYDYRDAASVRDEYLEHIKREIGLQELGSYIARYGLDEVAQAVDMALTKIPKRPNGLIDAISKLGRIKPDVNLKERGITAKRVPSLYSSDGISADQMMKELIDDGFFPEYKNYDPNQPEKYMIDDLREAIEEDAFGDGVYRDADARDIDEIRLLERISDEASQFLNNTGYTDYKNFYKDIYNDITSTKRSLKSDAKAERERLKTAKKTAREVSRDNKVFRDEVKRLRNAQKATYKKEITLNKNKIKKLERKIEKAEERKIEEIIPYRNAVGEGYSERSDEMVRDITNNITGNAFRKDIPSWIVPLERGPFKNKTFDVKDVDFEDFLENDIRALMDYHRNTVGPQIEFQRAFGNLDMETQLQDINDEFEELISNATSTKERKKLSTEKHKVMRDIKAVRDSFLNNNNGAYDPDSIVYQASQVVRDTNFMRSLGGVTISSLSDIPRGIMVNGLSNFIDGNIMKKMSKDLAKLSREDLEQMGFWAEAVTSSRLQTLAEVGDPFAQGTALTRFTNNASNVFSKVTLINHWNDIQKSLAAGATQSRVMKAIKSGEDTAFLNEMGLGAEEVRIIKGQMSKHSDEYSMNLREWDSDAHVQDVVREYSAGVRRMADIAIVTAGKGDLPWFSSHPLGKLGLQFRSFMIASHSRVLIRALQSNNKEAGSAILGATAMVGMGMMVAAIKAELSNRSAGLRGSDTNYDTSTWNKRKWIAEGFDRAGVAALFTEALNMSDKTIGFGPSTFTGQGTATRFGARGAFAGVLGPSYGLGSDLFLTAQTAGRLATGNDVSKSDLYTARRLIPFQNAFIFRQMFDILEKETGEAVGAK